MLKELFDLAMKVATVVLIIKAICFVIKKAAPAVVSNVTPRYDGTTPLQYNVYRL